jgi:hypothetical protein
MSKDLHCEQFSEKIYCILNKILVLFHIQVATKHPIDIKAHGSDSRVRHALEHRQVQLLVGLALPRRHGRHGAVELCGGQRTAGTAPPRQDLRGGSDGPGW